MFIKKENYREFEVRRFIFFEAPQDKDVSDIKVDRENNKTSFTVIRETKENLKKAQTQIEVELDKTKSDLQEKLENNQKNPNQSKVDIAMLGLGKLNDEVPKPSLESLKLFELLSGKNPPPSPSELQAFCNQNNLETAKINRIGVGIYLASKLEKREGDSIKTPNFIDLLTILKGENLPLESNPIKRILNFDQIQDQKEIIRIYISQKFELAGLGVLREIIPGKTEGDLEKPTIFVIEKDNVESKFAIKPLSNGLFKIDFIQDGETSMNGRSNDNTLMSCLNTIANIYRISDAMSTKIKIEN